MYAVILALMAFTAPSDNAVRSLFVANGIAVYCQCLSKYVINKYVVSLAAMIERGTLAFPTVIRFVD